jgi:hypothetical protein
MKSLKSYLLIALFALSTVCVPSVFATSVKPVKGIDVVVQKNPGNSASRQHATVGADGKIMIKLAEPGTYTIKYADGSSKGKVLWSGEVKKAQSVSCKVDKEYVPAPSDGTVIKSHSNVKNN